MKVSSPRFLALAILIVGAAVFAAGFVVSSQVCARHWASGMDDLEWLRAEFGLGPGELERVRVLHEGYRPVCQEMCDRIAAKKEELRKELEAGGGLSTAARTKLDEVALLRAQCQARMLEHFGAVAREMPAEQGRRYLATMRDLTLGFHEQVEASMTGGGGGGHHHGHE
jgi:hypothetical protein